MLAIIERHRDKVEGIKISLLDADKEVALRSRLPDGVLMFTGDDFNYAELIAGDGERHSHALLGIFDAIAPVANAALGRLAADDVDGFHALIAPTVPLSRAIFEAPTAVLQGRHRLPRLAERPPGPFHHGRRHAVGARRSCHYADVFRLADQAGLLARSGAGSVEDEEPLRGVGRLGPEHFS